MDLTERIRTLRDLLSQGLVERDVEVRLALVATLAGEHTLLLGPPGTAKSLVARRLHLAFSASTYFERLLTRFTVPEELFGPLSIKGLEDDRYERLTASYLPTASIAFLDEVFKANSAILNALLTLLNEREFDNGAVRVRTPLVAVVGASNELPDGDELDALFDRFLVRLHVGPVSSDGFRELVRMRGDSGPVVPDDIRLGTDELAEIRAAAGAVAVPDDVEALLYELREWCAAEGVAVSDRRWRKVVRLLQTSALTNGRSAVSVWDCWLLQHCLWGRPEDREKVYGWYTERVGTSKAMDPSRLTRVVVAWEAQLNEDQGSRSQTRDTDGRLLFAGAGGEPTVEPRGNVQKRRKDEALFLAPANSSTRGDYYFSQGAIQDRTNGKSGYTEAELNEVYVQPTRGGTMHRFEDWQDRGLYLTDPSNWLAVDGEFPPVMEPTRHKGLYIEDTLRQVDELRDDVTAYEAALAAHVGTMEDEIRSHLWVTADFVGPAQLTLGETRREVGALRARVERVRKGFELLPRDEGRHPASRPVAPAVPGPTATTTEPSGV